MYGLILPFRSYLCWCSGWNHPCSRSESKSGSRGWYHYY